MEMLNLQYGYGGDNQGVVHSLPINKYVHGCPEEYLLYMVDLPTHPFADPAERIALQGRKGKGSLSGPQSVEHVNMVAWCWRFDPPLRYRGTTTNPAEAFTKQNKQLRAKTG